MRADYTENQSPWMMGVVTVSGIADVTWSKDASNPAIT